MRSLEDFTTKVPVVTKKDLVADQAEHPPFGSYLGVQRSEIARVHGSSGTMGTPDDVRRLARRLGPRRPGHGAWACGAPGSAPATWCR